LGFTYFFFKGDNQRALPYLKQAASFPEAHSGVARFAAVVSAQELGPEQTIRFLIELEQSVGSGSVREVIRENMKEMALAHNLSQLNEAIEAYREQNRELPPSIDALVGAGLITGIPPDPFGGHFEIDPASGTARSSTGKVPSQLHTSRIRERALEGKSGDELLMP
jgi:hypothetical protein